MGEKTGDSPPNNIHNHRNTMGSRQRSTRARNSGSRVPSVNKEKNGERRNLIKGWTDHQESTKLDSRKYNNMETIGDSPYCKRKLLETIYTGG